MSPNRPDLTNTLCSADNIPVQVKLNLGQGHQNVLNS